MRVMPRSVFRSRQNPQKTALGPGGPGFFPLIFYKKEIEIIKYMCPLK
jgi:hypothetical protein